MKREEFHWKMRSWVLELITMLLQCGLKLILHLVMEGFIILDMVLTRSNNCKIKTQIKKILLKKLKIVFFHLSKIQEFQINGNLKVAKRLKKLKKCLAEMLKILRKLQFKWAHLHKIPLKIPDLVKEGKIEFMKTLTNSKSNSIKGQQLPKWKNKTQVN